MPCERSGESVDERDRLHRHEEALYKKFSAVFDDLCFSPSSHESWFRAGQCVMEKIDAISDRIRFGTNMCSDSNLLFPPFNCKQRTLSNEQHNTIQLNTKDRSDLSSVDSIELFHDLESFLEQPWSKFSSIKYVATNLQESNPSNPLKEKLEYLQQLYSNRDFAVWQNIWGSLFIVSLRLICYRCFFTSLYLAKSAIAKRQSNDSILNALVSGKICYNILFPISTKYISLTFPTLSWINRNVRNSWIHPLYRNAPVSSTWIFDLSNAPQSKVRNCRKRSGLLSVFN